MSEPSATPRPDFSRDALVDLAGWEVLREARRLLEAGAVREAVWQPPAAVGKVGLGGMIFRPRLDFSNPRFPANRCSCRPGRDGILCAHAIAVCLELGRPPPAVAAPPVESPVEPVAAPGPRSLTLAPDGHPVGLRLLLPPNLAQAAPRDAIGIGVRLLTREGLWPPEKLPRDRRWVLGPAEVRAVVLLEEWGGGRLAGLIQLRRTQLQALHDLLRDTSDFAAWNRPDQPLSWVDGRLAGVFEHLGPTAPAGAAAPRRESAPAGSRAPDLAVAAREPVVPVTATPRPIARVPAPAPAARATPSEPAAFLLDGGPGYLTAALAEPTSATGRGARDFLKAAGFEPDPRTGKLWLRGRHAVLNFLASTRERLAAEFLVQYAPALEAHLNAFSWAHAQTRLAVQGDSATVELELGADGFSPEDLQQAVAGGRAYVEREGRVALLPAALLERLRRLQTRLEGAADQPLQMRFQRRLLKAGWREAESALEDFDPTLVPPRDWTSATRALRDTSCLAPAPIRRKLDEQLRSYQRLGAAWLWHLHQQGLGGILADEMGLGKTVQALALLDAAARAAAPAQPRPVLVVAPAGLLENWRRESSRFLPDRPVFLHHGENRLTEPADFRPGLIVLTSYGTLVRDQDLLAGVEFGVVLADEAQHVKNRRTQAAAALRRLRAPARFVLTGTPVENSLEDLRALFEFLLPGYLPRLPGSLRGEDRAWADERDRRRAAPYLLRRTKRMVAPELPDKISQVVWCPPTPAQHVLYQRTREDTERALQELEFAGAGEGRLRLAALTQLLRLRQVCTEPRLLDPALTAPDSAKLAAWEEILQEALDDGHRILLFSQFTSVLAHLADSLREAAIPFAYLDGETPPARRQAECDRFNGDPQIPVFLISLKAGGTGLNLTGADTVVHFDPWWNPAVEDQATDRAHRLGQTRTVNVYKLLVPGTVEEKVLQLQTDKAHLLRDLLEESAAANSRLSLADLRSLVSG